MRPERRGLPPEARFLRDASPAPYVYRSRAKRAAAAALDALGDVCLAVEPPSVDWSGVRRLAVLRLDHLGDLLNCLPALRRLKMALPEAEIDLWVGPWGRELAALFADVDTVRVAEAPWFQRPSRKSWPWSSIASLAVGLRLGRYDAAFELRGDLRHHLALAGSGIAVRAGQALTAGRFLLTHPARWIAGLHEQDQNLALLDQCAVPEAAAGRRPYLKLTIAARREAAALCRSLKLGAAPVLVQVPCGIRSKRWSPNYWAELLDGLPAGRSAVLLGAAEDAEELRHVAERTGRPVALACGLAWPVLAALFERAGLLVSVDTGNATLAALQGAPVLSLFSGAAEARRWAPRGSRVRVLQASGFPCSPCALSDCPYENACMKALEPADVLAHARRLLRVFRPALARRA